MSLGCKLKSLAMLSDTDKLIYFIPQPFDLRFFVEIADSKAEEKGELIL